MSDHDYDTSLEVLFRYIDDSISDNTPDRDFVLNIFSVHEAAFKEFTQLRECVFSMRELINLVHRYENGDIQVPWQVVRQQLAEWVDSYYTVGGKK